jgi:CshA-type fibril repeat protein
VNPDGSYTYTPSPGYTGVDTFTFTVTDTSGQTATGTATITVEPLAVAKNDKVTAKSGQAITIDPLANDAATGGSTFDLATLRFLDPTTGNPVIQATVANVGTWQMVGTLFQFTPVPGYVGTASIGYQVTDTAGDVVSATASVVYPQLTTLAHTGIDRGELDGSLSAGILALLLGLALLLFERRRRIQSATRRRPRHSTATA